MSTNVVSCADSMLTSTVIQLGFLGNLVKVFPGLKTRPLHLVSESFGGRFVVRPLFHLKPLSSVHRAFFQSFIAKHYFGMENPPVNLKKIAIGRGMISAEIGRAHV